MSLIGVASYRQSFTVLQPVTENFKIVFLQVQKFTLNPVLISVEGGTVRVVGEHNEKDQVISFSDILEKWLVGEYYADYY